MNGLLIEVATTTQGSAATADVAIGETVVPVENLTDFDAEGGRVDIVGVVYDYTGVDTSTVDADGSGGALTLASPLTVAVAEFDPVLLLAGDVPAVDYYAVVDLGPDDDGEVVWVPLDYTQRLAFPVRAYDPPLAVTVADDLSAVLEVPGSIPQLDGGLIDPDTLPTPMPQTFSADAPSETTGFGEGHAWWQVVDGEVQGFWRLMGGEWVPQEIVTADALVATNALITALGVVDLTAVTVTGLSIQTDARDDHGIHLDADGLRAYGPDGGAPFLDVDPAAGMAIVAGKVTAETLTTTEGTSLGGETVVPTGSKITLLGSAAVPTSAPTVGSSWPSVMLPQPDVEGWGVRVGVALNADGDVFYTANETTGELETRALVDGSLASTEFAPSGTPVAVTSGDGNVYALYKQYDGTFDLLRWSSSPVSFQAFVHLPTTAYDAASSRLPALGWDASAASDGLLVAQAAADGTVKIRRVDFTGSTATVGSTVNTGITYDRDLASVLYAPSAAPFDFAAGTGDRYVFTDRDSGDIRVYNTTGASTATEDWHGSTGANIHKVGLWWDGTNFRCLLPNGNIRTYTGLHKDDVAEGAAALTKWVSHTFYRSDGPWETPQSPAAQVTAKKRGVLDVTANALPSSPGASDPNQVRIYVGEGATAPARTAMVRQTAPSVGEITATYDTLTRPPSANNPPTTNTFPASDAAAVESDKVDASGAPMVRITGDDVGRDSGLLSATGAFFAGGFRFVRVGRMVFASGSITRASGFNTSFSTTSVTVPLGMRPVAQEDLSAASFYGTSDDYQFRVLDTGDVQVRQSAASTSKMILNAVWFTD